MSEFVKIAGSTLLLKHFLPVAKSLLHRMINQAGSKQLLLKQIKKAFNRHPKAFQNIILSLQILQVKLLQLEVFLIARG